MFPAMGKSLVFDYQRLALICVFIIGFANLDAMPVEKRAIADLENDLVDADDDAAAFANRTFSFFDVKFAQRGLYQGDILPNDNERSALSNMLFRWCDATVPYTIDTYTPTELALFDQVFRDFADVGITFKVREFEGDYVHISNTSQGCSSNVGRIGGRQIVYLPSLCFNQLEFGTIHHELMHALGFFHEQSRPDRDNYVTILEGNIRSGSESNFNTEYFSTTSGTPYDYYSVMHYPEWAFGEPAGAITIVPKGIPGSSLGNRAGFSSTDREEIRRVYAAEKRLLWPYCQFASTFLGPLEDSESSAQTTVDDASKRGTYLTRRTFTFGDMTSSTTL